MSAEPIPTPEPGHPRRRRAAIAMAASGAALVLGGITWPAAGAISGRLSATVHSETVADALSAAFTPIVTAARLAGAVAGGGGR